MLIIWSLNVKTLNDEEKLIIKIGSGKSMYLIGLIFIDILLIQSGITFSTFGFWFIQVLWFIGLLIANYFDG